MNEEPDSPSTPVLIYAPVTLTQHPLTARGVVSFCTIPTFTKGEASEARQGSMHDTYHRGSQGFFLFVGVFVRGGGVRGCESRMLTKRMTRRTSMARNARLLTQLTVARHS